MKIICKIDTRERKLIQIITPLFESRYRDKYDIQLDICNLDLGDIVITDEHENTLMIIERKTLNDLLASIKDGRYKNQSQRLNAINIDNHNIVYLIEGNIMFPNITTTQRDQILSSCFSLTHTKGFSLYKSTNLQETAEYILRVCYKFFKNETTKQETKSMSTENVIDFSENKVCLSNNTDEVNEVNEPNDKKKSSSCSLIDIKKMKKNKHINSENIHIMMLCQVPGISEKTGSMIIDHYKSSYDFISYIRDNREEFTKRTIYWNTDEGKTIKLRKDVSQKLLEYF